MNPKTTTPKAPASPVATSPPEAPAKPAAPSGEATEQFDRLLGAGKSAAAEPGTPKPQSQTPASPMDLLRGARPSAQAVSAPVSGQSSQAAASPGLPGSGQGLAGENSGSGEGFEAAEDWLRGPAKGLPQRGAMNPPSTEALGPSHSSAHTLAETGALVQRPASPGKGEPSLPVEEPDELSAEGLPLSSQVTDTAAATSQRGAVGELHTSASPAADRAAEINELVRTVASRVLVSDAASATQGEVRITLQDSVLPGTEVIIQREAGRLKIQLVSHNPESLQFLQQNQQALQSGLQERLRGEDLVVQVSQQSDAGDSGQDSQGRSRQQRDLYSEWQAEQE